MMKTKNNIKAVVLDIDGTLLNSNHEISEKTKNKLIEIQKQGVKVMLASGRPTMGLFKMAKQLKLDKYEGFLVSYNGAVVSDCQTGEEIYKKTMKLEIAKEVLKHVKKYDIIAALYDGEYLCVENAYNCNINGVKSSPFNVLEHESKGNDMLLKEVRNLEDYLTYDPTKILISGDPGKLQNLYKELSKPFVGKLNCMFTAPYFYEFTDLGIDKATALATALPKYGIEKENIIAFGDGQNDKSMVEYAGIGVAMGNAIDELKNVADFISTSNDEDGIVFALDHYGI